MAKSLELIGITLLMRCSVGEDGRNQSVTLMPVDAPCSLRKFTPIMPQLQILLIKTSTNK